MRIEVYPEFVSIPFVGEIRRPREISVDDWFEMFEKEEEMQEAYEEGRRSVEYEEDWK